MMRRSLLIVLVCLVCLTLVHARDDIQSFPIEPVLDSEHGKEKLVDVALYFGDQAHPKVVKEIGEWSTSKKTNAFHKSDQEACDWAFLSALITMQQRALREGGNAIINIKSNYKNVETSSETEYKCGAGNVIAGVAIKGTVVEIQK